MNNRIKYSVAILFICIQVLFLQFILKSENAAESVDINEIVFYAKQHWKDLDEDELRLLTSLDFTILNDEEIVMYSTKADIAQNIQDAINHQDLIISIADNGQDQGTILFHNTSDERIQTIKYRCMILLIFDLLCMILFIVLNYYFVRKKILNPFQKLQEFAQRVAHGNLDIPLEMDEHHAFGAFSESFDLMRDELKKAREQEAKANQSKKELVAKLSHDIKTPVASIKAISELMALQNQDVKIQEQANIINSKADQIDMLISNLFHATLEELQQLPVTPIACGSNLLIELLQKADYLHKATIDDVPQCLLNIDEQRLQQVFDNIFNNSYKYANTSIHVAFELEEDFIIHILDAGKGVKNEDVTRLCDKFYRGQNAEGKSGSGLGLYISKYLLEQMDGSICCENTAQGFLVQIYLKLIN